MRSKQLKVINPVPDITLFAVNMITRGFQQPKWKKYIGLNFDETVSAYEDNFVEWCVPLPLWKKLGKSFLNKIFTNHSFASLIYKMHFKYGQEVYKQSDNIRQLDIKKLSDKQILEILKQLQKNFHELCFWGVVPPALDFESNLLTNKLEDELRKSIRKYPNKKTFQEIFSILMTPEELTYFQKENTDLLKLAAKKKLKKEDIIKHHYKYCWVDYGYLGPVHPITYYKKIIVELNRGKQSPKNKLITLIRERKQVLTNQKKLARNLHFNAQTKYLFGVARQFMFLKLYRKEVMFKSYYAFHILFKEIGKRFDFTVKQLNYCLPEEIIKIINGKRINKKEIDKRLSDYFVHVARRGKDYFYYGQEARQYMKRNLILEKFDTSLKKVKRYVSVFR